MAFCTLQVFAGEAVIDVAHRVVVGAKDDIVGRYVEDARSCRHGDVTVLTAVNVESDVISVYDVIVRHVLPSWSGDEGQRLT